MLIRIYLSLYGLALAALVAAGALSLLAITGLPEHLASIGVVLLLGTFALWLTLDLLFAAKQACHGIADFFSRRRCAQRRLLYAVNREQRLAHLHQCQIAQIQYLSAAQRKRLLRANDRKHIRALSDRIVRELQAHKSYLPATSFRQWLRDNDRYRSRLDADGLLALQQKITTARYDHESR